MKVHGVLLWFGWMACTSATAEAGTQHGQDGIDVSTAREYDAGTQAAHEELALAGARIKSLAEFYAYEFSVPPLANPLNRLSQGARRRFIDSLTFNDRGITGYATGDLRAELSAEQIYDILVLFGVPDDIYLFPDARVSTRRDKEIMEKAHRLLTMDYRHHRRIEPFFPRRSPGPACSSRCAE